MNAPRRSPVRVLRSVAPAAVIAWGILLAPGLNAAQGDSQGTRAPKRADDDVARKALDRAPPRGKLGRMRGVRIISEVTFVAAPDEPHEVALSVGFPARSRLVLSRAGKRIERYQLGDTWLGLDQLADGPTDRSRSFVLQGPGRDETRLDLALRRALFLWPDETTFEGAGTTFSAKIGGIGVLIATVDEATGRPTRMQAFDRRGKSLAELRDVVWSTEGRRPWPKSLTFAATGQPIWHEVVQRIEDEWNFADTWFLPSDRTAQLVGRPNDSALRMRPMEAAWTRRTPLPPGTSLQAALERARPEWKRAKDALAKRGLEPTMAVMAILDEHRSPVALQVEVHSNAKSDAGLGDDEAWTKRDAAMSWNYLCSTREGVTDGAFDAVAAAVAQSGKPLGPAAVQLDLSDRGPLRIVQAMAVADRPKSGAKRDLDR